MKDLLLIFSCFLLFTPIYSENLNANYQQSICFFKTMKIQQVSDTWGFAGIAEPVVNEYIWRHYIDFSLPYDTFVKNAKLKIYYANSDRKGNSSELQLHHFPEWKHCDMSSTLNLCYATLNNQSLYLLNSSFIKDNDGIGFYEQDITNQWNNNSFLKIPTLNFMLKQAVEYSDIYNYHRYKIDVNNVFIEYTADETPLIISAAANPFKIQNKGTVTFSSEVNDVSPGTGITRRFCKDLECNNIYCETNENQCSAFIDTNESAVKFYSIACDSYGSCSPAFESEFFVNHAPVFNPYFTPNKSHNSTFLLIWEKAFDSDNDTLTYNLERNNKTLASTLENKFLINGCEYNKNCTVKINVCDSFSCSENFSLSVFVFDNPIEAGNFSMSQNYFAGAGNLSLNLGCTDIDSINDFKGCYFETENGNISGCSADASVSLGSNKFRGCCVDFLNNVNCSEYKTAVRLDPKYLDWKQENVTADFGNSYSLSFLENIVLNNSLSEKEWHGHIECDGGDWVNYAGNSERPPKKYDVSVPAFSVLNKTCEHIFENAVFVSDCVKSYFEDCDAGISGVCIERCPVTLKNNIDFNVSFELLHRNFTLNSKQDILENFIFNSTGSVLFSQSEFFSDNSSDTDFQVVCSNISLINTLNHAVFADFFPEEPNGFILSESYENKEVLNELNLTVCWLGSWINKNSSFVLMNKSVNISDTGQFITYNLSSLIKNNMDTDFYNLLLNETVFNLTKNETKIIEKIYFYECPKIVSESKNSSDSLYEYYINLSVADEKCNELELIYYLNKSNLADFEKRSSFSISSGKAEILNDTVKIIFGNLNLGENIIKLLYAVEKKVIIYEKIVVTEPQVESNSNDAPENEPDAGSSNAPQMITVKNLTFEFPDNFSMEFNELKNVSAVMQNTGNAALTNITLLIEGFNSKIFSNHSFSLNPNEVAAVIVEFNSSDSEHEDYNINLTLSGDINLNKTTKIFVKKPETLQQWNLKSNKSNEVEEELTFSEAGQKNEALTGNFVKAKENPINENKNFELIMVIFFLCSGILTLSILTGKKHKDF